MGNQISWADFEKIDLRIGTIIKAEAYPEARNPSYKLEIDLGSDLGTKKSCAQITAHYSPIELLGRQVVCVVNFPPKQVGKFMSEVLVTGFSDAKGSVILASAERSVPNGAKLF